MSATARDEPSSSRKRLLSIVQTELKMWRARLSECTSQIEMLEETERTLRKYETTDAVFRTEAVKGISTVDLVFAPGVQQNLSATVRSFAMRALRNSGRPMTRRELLDLLLEAGVEVPGEDPAKRIGKIMWKAREFVGTDQGYWIEGEPLP